MSQETVDMDWDGDPPHSLYAVEWRDRKHPEYTGIVWQYDTPWGSVPFQTEEQAISYAQKLAYSQETRVLV